MNNEYILACNNVCFVKIPIFHNLDYYWLIDTGATISAIKYAHVAEQNIPIHVGNTMINGIGGKVRAMGYVNIDLNIENHVLNHRFFVFESLPCKAHGILGQDFLSKHMSVLDFANKSLTIWQNSINKLDFPLILESNHKNSYFIPARSESLHHISTDETEECLVCASEIQEGVYIASTLCTPKNGKLLIQILNTTDRDFTLSEIKPNTQKICDYDVCNFKENKLNSDRVKQLFSHLKLQHLNNEERISIENLTAKYSDIFYLPGDTLHTTPIYKHYIRMQPNTDPIIRKAVQAALFTKR